MAIPTSGFFRLVLTSSLFGQQVKNVLHYSVDGITLTDPAGVAEAWWNDVKAGWRAAVVIPMTMLTVELYDNDDPTGDYGSYAIPAGEQPGLNGSDVGSPNLAWGYKFNVPTRVTKPGSMRLGGVRVSDIGANGVPSAGQITKLTTLATALAAGFNWGLLDAGISLLQVYGAPHPASTRYPDRPAAVYQEVSAISLYPYLTTQNSRKVGRGA